MSCRCIENVFINNTKRGRKCKKNKYFIGMCYSHYKMKFLKPALIIQSIFRGNKLRNKINNIYSLLPEDIQLNIIKYIRIDYNYSKYVKVINKIIEKKVKDEYNNFLNISHNLYFNINDIININKIINKLINIYTLINKYFSILNINNVEYKSLYEFAYIHSSNPELYLISPQLTTELIVFEDIYEYNLIYSILV